MKAEEESERCLGYMIKQLTNGVFLMLLEVVPAEVGSVVLQSVDGTQTEQQMSGGETLNPVLLNSTLCANVVLKVSQPDSNT